MLGHKLHYEIKVTFGHKLHYAIKVMLGEIFLKLRQTSWDVAKNNVNVVADKLPRQITFNTCLTIEIWTRRHQRTSMWFYAVPSAQNGGLPVKLAPIFFKLYYGHP
jgi:hypothetical protein